MPRAAEVGKAVDDHSEVDLCEGPVDNATVRRPPGERGLTEPVPLGEVLDPVPTLTQRQRVRKIRLDPRQQPRLGVSNDSNGLTKQEDGLVEVSASVTARALQVGHRQLHHASGALRVHVGVIDGVRQQADRLLDVLGATGTRRGQQGVGDDIRSVAGRQHGSDGPGTVHNLGPASDDLVEALGVAGGLELID